MRVELERGLKSILIRLGCSIIVGIDAGSSNGRTAVSGTANPSSNLGPAIPLTYSNDVCSLGNI